MKNVGVLFDKSHSEIAQMSIEAIEDEWCYGILLSRRFSEDIERVVQWYGEVVENQMLSFLDEALDDICRLHITIKLPCGDIKNVHSLHVSCGNQATIRIGDSK